MHSDNAESTSRDENNLLVKLKTFVLLKTTVIEVPVSNSEKIARLRDIFDLGPQGSYVYMAVKKNKEATKFANK